MRSRYSAYTLNEIDYLLVSWHPQTRPLRSEFENTAPLDWQRLQIINVNQGQPDDLNGTVTFIASYLTNNALQQLCETSRFQREGQQWLYLDGQVTLISKNGPCPCGSGKKYKRCCLLK